MSSYETIEQLTQKVKDFCEKREWDQFHNPKDLAIGISTEANELLEIFRFMTEKQMKNLFQRVETREHIEEELADVFFFVLRFAQMNELDLAKCLEMKLRKNEIKYPVEKIRGKNLKYTDIS